MSRGARCRVAAFGGRRPTGEERGESLVELAVAAAVIGLVLAMSVVIVSVVVRTGATGVDEGVTADAVQSGMGALASYLAGMVTPQDAVLASVADPTPLTVPAVCWGATDPATTPTSQALPGVVPPFLAVDFGWDFAVQFCAYPPGSSDAVPHVYEAFVNGATCTTTAGIPTCTLQVLDFGTGFGANQASCALVCTTMYPGITAPGPQAVPPGTAAVVSALPGVWCDAFCQHGTSCQSELAAGAAVTLGGTTCSGATVTGTTPPLFNYYAAGAARSTEPSDGSPPGPGAPPGSFLGTMNLSTTGGPSPTLDLDQADGFGGSGGSQLASLGALALNVTVYPGAPTGPGHPPATAPVRVTDQIPVPGPG